MANSLAATIGKLHYFLTSEQLSEGALVGPDPGVRFNYRIWRFLKSATRWVQWSDDLCYQQAQGYWMLANWKLEDWKTNQSASTSGVACDPQVGAPTDIEPSISHVDYAQIAIDCADFVVKVQRPDGAWDYPNPEWKNRVATVEGIWAALGLLETYQRTGQARFLDSVLRWHDFFINQIGFQPYGRGVAVNYFAHQVELPVPNNSALALRYLASLDRARQSNEHDELCAQLLQFLSDVQQPSGEFPYEVEVPAMQHFQCYQYHGFILHDLIEYYCLTEDQRVTSIMPGIADFLQTGIKPDGTVCYQCGIDYRSVNYHAAAVVSALHRFQRIFDQQKQNRQPTISVVQQSLLGKQRSDGSFPHSIGDYRILADKRSYPRYLVMILYHFLLMLDIRTINPGYPTAATASSNSP